MNIVRATGLSGIPHFQDVIYVLMWHGYIYIVNSSKSSLSYLICLRKVIGSNRDCDEVQLQCFHWYNFFIVFSFNWEWVATDQFSKWNTSSFLEIRSLFVFINVNRLNNTFDIPLFFYSIYSILLSFKKNSSLSLIYYRC